MNLETKPPKNQNEKKNSTQQKHDIEKSSKTETAAVAVASTANFQCNICRSSFDDLKVLEVHIRNHLDDSPYRCYKCRGVFWSLEKLVKHANVKHLNESHAFMCKFCLKLFDGSDEYIAHDMTHTSELGFDCLDCGKVFETNDLLVEHRQIHIGDRVYACRICDQRFTRADQMTWHIRKHNNLPSYQCKFCERKFSRVLNLSGHIQRAHKGVYSDSDLLLINIMSETDRQMEQPANLPDTESVPSMFFINQIIETLELIKKYKCPVCHLAFVKEETVQIHCKRNHPGVSVAKQLKNLPVDLNGDITAVIQRQQQCPACNELFPSKTEVVAHLRSVHGSQTPFKCSLCGFLFARAKTLEEHIQSHFSLAIKCDYCHKVFQHKLSLRKHIQRHIGPNVVKCSVCGVPYTDQKFLNNHMRCHAVDGKPHKCDYCEKRFIQSCDKTKHMRIHTGELPFECGICHKKFRQLTSIKKHRYTHTGERNFQCTTCGKAFRYSSNLSVHMRTHSGQRPYSCGHCDKTFVTSSHLSDHIKVHEGKRDYKCDVCDKSFLHNSSFSKHKRMHSGEKPYQCEYCAKRFSQLSHYKEHIRIHTNERPFECDQCESKFRRKDALRIHLETHKRGNERQRSRKSSSSSDSVIDADPANNGKDNISDANEQNQIDTPAFVGCDGFTNFSYKISL